jgi:hypothetical protein
MLDKRIERDNAPNMVLDVEGDLDNNDSVFGLACVPCAITSNLDATGICTRTTMEASLNLLYNVMNPFNWYILHVHLLVLT